MRRFDRIKVRVTPQIGNGRLLVGEITYRRGDTFHIKRGSVAERHIGEGFLEVVKGWWRR